MKKKIGVVLLALILLLGCAACGEEEVEETVLPEYGSAGRAYKFERFLDDGTVESYIGEGYEFSSFFLRLDLVEAEEAVDTDAQLCYRVALNCQERNDPKDEVVVSFTQTQIVINDVAYEVVEGHKYYDYAFLLEEIQRMYEWDTSHYAWEVETSNG